MLRVRQNMAIEPLRAHPSTLPAMQPSRQVPPHVNRLSGAINLCRRALFPPAARIERKKPLTEREGAVPRPKFFASAQYVSRPEEKRKRTERLIKCTSTLTETLHAKVVLVTHTQKKKKEQT